MKHQQRPSRRTLTIRYWPRPCCPFCGGWRLRIRRTQAQGDGSILRWVTCLNLDCQKPSKCVLEPK